MNAPHRLRSSAAGAILGLVALILVAAILGGALSAIQANKTASALGAQLTQARAQIAALHASNDNLTAQNRQILEQNRQLIIFLRRHGLKVPTTINTAPETGTPLSQPPAPTHTADADPKAPRPTAGPPHQGPSPNPTTTPSPRRSPTATPTPTSPPGLGQLCDLVPILCADIAATTPTG